MAKAAIETAPSNEASMDHAIPLSPGYINPVFDPRYRVPLRGLTALGRGMYEKTFAITDNDDEAFRLCLRWMEAAHGQRLDRPPQPDETETADNAGAFWAAKWCASGFPRLRIRGLRAASLAATAIPGDVVASVRPPWRAFLVRLEDAQDLLPDPHNAGVFYDHIEVLYSSVLTGLPTWSFWRRSQVAGEHAMIATPAEAWGSDLDSLQLFDRVNDDPQARIFRNRSRG